MFDFDVSEEHIAYAKELAEKHNLGNRGEFDGNKEQQITGIIGQIVIQDFFGVPRMTGDEGFDGGVDLEYGGVRIDVKTMGRTVKPEEHYVNNIVASQIGYISEAFILVSYHKRRRILTVCGWIMKDELLESAVYCPKGSIRERDDGTKFTVEADMYEIRNDRINGVNKPNELKEQLDMVYPF